MTAKARSVFGALALALLTLPMLALAGCKPERAPETAASPAAVGVQIAAAPPSSETPSVEPTAVGKPALWKTGDSDTTVYFLGTVHVLPPALAWRGEAIDRAIAASRAVYFETDIDPSPAQMNLLVQRLGLYPPGQSLSNRLTREERRIIADAASKLSVSMTQLEQMRPWMASIALSEPVIRRAGYNPESGVERTIAPIARAQGKEIRTLETVEQQLLAFADLPERVQIDYLVDGLKRIDQDAATLDGLVRAWAAGDIDKLAELMITDDMETQPAIKQALLVNRNRNWAVKLDQLIRNEPGVFFVAVGAAHLTGPDSVNRMLEQRGYTLERLQ
jgi:uncharacterized protein YbaP (TraB family)